MPFQSAGSIWLASRSRGMLAWDPGTGKTPTAVTACDRVQASRILVLCPPIATAVWARHFEDWSRFRHDIWLLTDPRNAYRICQLPGVTIVPYSLTGREQHEFVVNAMARWPWDVVILDECHYLKNPLAKRTRAVYGKKLDTQGSPCAQARHVWCLSGTPLLNNAFEFFTHLNALAPETLMVGAQKMSAQHFLNRFCLFKATAYGEHIYGSKNTAELAQRVKPFMDRKRMKEVLPQMPSLRIVETPLPKDTPIPIELRAELDQLLVDLDVQDFDDLSDEELLASMQSGSVAFSTARRLIGQAKAKGAAELIEDELAGSADKLIVFAHHRNVIDSLQRQLSKHAPLVIHGGTSQRERDENITMFQRDPNHFRLIILAIEAAGEAITLTAAHRVIIVEPSPVPARNAQAIGRSHRLGQKASVLASFVLLPGTIDARLMSIAARKTRDIARIIDPDIAPVQPQTAATAFPEEDRI